MRKHIVFCLVLAILPLSAHADRYSGDRQKMVDGQIIARGVSDERVIEAMSTVPREEFVGSGNKNKAYKDTPLSIGFGQTISQPYIVAFMTEAARLEPDDKVLEIGTGSGYQAAVLAEIVKEVYTVEIIKQLAEKAERQLNYLGYKNVRVKQGDGYKGWPEHAPYDAIIVTAAPKEIPEELIKQLKMGGRMVVPVGDMSQELYLITKTMTGVKKETLLPVRFVPMVHEK